MRLVERSGRSLTISKGIDGLGVPLVGATRAGSGVARAVGRSESHVGHGDLVDVVAGVHGRGKTASWGDLAKDDVGKGLTTILTCCSCVRYDSDGSEYCHVLPG